MVAVQLKNSAPVADDGVAAGEAVDPKWASEHGHAHAALRYGAMSRPSPWTPPPEEPDDWRSCELERLLRRQDEERDNPSRRYFQV